LTLRKMKHICRRVEQTGSKNLGRVVNNTLMTGFMPDRERRVVEKCMKRCGIHQDTDVDLASKEYALDENLLKSCHRTASNPLLVPNPRFEENPGQARVMGDILEAHSVGERALLISGYQGVGKNRIVDHLLSTLNCEREYLQLHRDTTIQSLVSAPSVEDGRIVFHDSPLVRAAKLGRILVLDEADKAPIEVVALLKGLIEDGQLSLPDGRILSYSDSSESGYIPIHPDFCIWTLTNPAGFPFHGNDLAREMADVFSCHNVPPMDVESHKRILLSYGPNVHNPIIEKIVDIWEELRVAHESGNIMYPFSIRESVAVVKHLNEYPDDGIEEAIENVIAFDRLDSGLVNQLDDVLGRYGVSVLDEKAAAARIGRAEGGVSTPKTRTSSPKFGKVDPDNVPHVGGNTWAGGTGGSDTAGLGGRGGPFRLDAGHPVHQISDEMKAEVSEEAQRKAREMAEEALEQKLKELDMGKLDWDRYDNLRQKVDVQIQQLRNHLKDLKKRNKERVWLKRQLDDSRIVDALSGEKDVFKRRGNPDDFNSDVSLNSDPVTIKLIVDISASMYRFNGYDGRLERLLEASVMIMEGLRDDPQFKLFLIGHNGSSAKIPLVDPDTSLDEATQLRILECMVANTQYTYAGDNTVEAIQSAVSEASKDDLVLVISDANLERYQITPEDLAPLQSRDVHAHFIIIGSLGLDSRLQEAPGEED
jgi:MoxR-like ATPase